MQGTLEEILLKAEQEISLTRQEILRVLSITRQSELDQVAKVARKIRSRYFHNKVFLYGFVYFSTYCRNNCSFCLYRQGNQSYPRYRKSNQEIQATARCLVNSGVHLLDLTMGEDPLYHHSQDGFRELIQMVKELKQGTEASIMISPGVISTEILRQFRKAGVDWYACYQETHNRDLYRELRLDQSFDERMNQKRKARELGFLIEEGLLAGVGESDEDIADSILTMRQMDADQVRVMTFVPQENTPLAGRPGNSHFRELLIIALMRLVMPDRLIPASLDVDGLKGLQERLNSGANVITSIIPPSAGMSGVSQSSLDIRDGKRTVEKIQPILKSHDLEAASAGDYQAWIKHRQALRTASGRGEILCG